MFERSIFQEEYVREIDIENMAQRIIIFSIVGKNSLYAVFVFKEQHILRVTLSRPVAGP